VLRTREAGTVGTSIGVPLSGARSASGHVAACAAIRFHASGTSGTVAAPERDAPPESPSAVVPRGVTPGEVDGGALTGVDGAVDAAGRGGGSLAFCIARTISAIATTNATSTKRSQGRVRREYARMMPLGRLRSATDHILGLRAAPHHR
jgi:hypothetical protein